MSGSMSGPSSPNSRTRSVVDNGPDLAISDEQRLRFLEIEGLRATAPEGGRLMTALVDATLAEVAFRDPGSQRRQSKGAPLARIRSRTEPEVARHANRHR